MNRRRVLAVTLALPLLAGCGAAADIAGVHDAPVERRDGGSVTAGTAREVTARVVSDAQGATRARGKDGAAAREATLMGPALREADAAAAGPTRSGSSSGSGEPQVLAVSEGPSWPRTILATSRTGSEQRLHVLVATSADRPYRLFADVPMAAGASVPAVADPGEGSPATLGAAPDEVTAAVDAWSRGVAHPEPTTRPSGVSFADAYSRALRSNAADQAEDLGDLATYRQAQRTEKGTVSSVGLADGGQLAFVPMSRTDTVVGGSRLQELTVDDPAVARLVGDESVDGRLTVTHAETLAVVVPAEGTAQVVGISEQLEGAKGS